MHYFVQDLIGVAAASLLALLLLTLPGFGIAALLARAGLIRDDSPGRVCWGLVLGLALLPAADALLLRWLGFAAVLVLHVALAFAGIRSALETARRVSPRWWAAVAACWLAAAWANVDFDWHGHLYQSASVIDGVKHAAVVGAIAKFGLPLHDPFFARAGPAGYYYYFYIGPALIHWLCGTLIDGRAAFAGATFTTLLAFPAMLILVAGEAALIPSGARRRFIKLTLVLCCVSGLDLLAGLWMLWKLGHVIAQLDWWSEEVRWALTSVLWVPHHIAAVIGVFVASLVLTVPGSPKIALRATVAGLAFATAFGCSTWIALGATPILALWWLWERAKLGSSGMWPLPLSGFVALLLSLPQIRDIEAGRAVSGPPLALYVRPIGPVRVLPHSIGEWIVHLAVLPGGYLIEFGIFALGAIYFLTKGPLARSRSTPIGRLLLVSAPAALLLATFVRSAILYNDFGWRVMWFAQAPALLWTASVLAEGREQLMRSPMWRAAFTLGLLASVWDMAGLRLVCPDYFPSLVNNHPEVDYSMRGAYRWADRAIPADVLIQHNPIAGARATDFGLYSDRPVAVADPEARLFGAENTAVEDRIALLTPIFVRPLSPAEIRERAAGAGVGGILLTSEDPLWRALGGPPRDWNCRYRSAHTCVMLLGIRQ